jgi:RHS repeat-associated protein
MTSVQTKFWQCSSSTPGLLSQPSTKKLLPWPQVLGVHNIPNSSSPCRNANRSPRVNNLYNYDAWGNLLAQAGWSPNYIGCSEATMGSVTADGNNHISAFTYDTQGNTQNDGTIAYTYDAESQIKTAAGVTYSYDGSGRRVSKSNGKLYWYGSGGEILAETDGSGNTLNEYIFLGGKRIAILPSGGNAQYYIEDLLGSSRAMTQNNGTPCYDADFDPFGGEHAYTNTCSQNYKFEGKERDTETGNDDFGARYYTSRFGRWLSADWSNVPVPVPYANLTNPQTLNLYAMVSDDPETSADLDGHEASQGVQYSTPTCAASGQPGGSSDSGCGSQAPNQAQTQQEAQDKNQQAQEKIAQVAQDKVDHTEYEQAKSKDNYKAGTNKCNQLCADVVQESGASRPKVPRSGILGWLGFTRDPTAHELADPNVHIAGWSSPMSVSSAKPGDIIAQAHGAYGHAGVVVWWNGKLQTVSVNSTTKPAGIVSRNDWGFRRRGENGEGPKDPAPVLRRYVGGDQ